MKDMQVKTNTIQTFLLAVLAVTFAVGMYVGYEIGKEYLRIKAIDDCGKISRFEKRIESEGVTVWYPEPGVYKACLDDKGIQ